ncbi:MAG TPA: hypothetical protein V6C71_15430 [Coleofasciculaceae cyanobacterium]|jgi:hypothetical protein
MIEKSVNKNKIKYITASVASTVSITIHFLAIADVWASSDADYTFITTSDWHTCQQIGAAYQEVYAFETTSFYINICQKERDYFYSGEAKQNNHNSIFIPAYPLEDNRGFQAENGNVDYVVILPFDNHNSSKSSREPEEAILTIKRNGQLVSVQSSLTKYCHQSKKAIADKLKLNPQSYNQLATLPLQDIGWDLSSTNPSELLPTELFHSNAHFDFYRIGGELYRLTTCN